ncbi:MAG: endolytic transglycosylase MltG, partial [Patescibacteria group bacterium]
VCFSIVFWFFYFAIYIGAAPYPPAWPPSLSVSLTLEVKEGDTAATLADRFTKDGLLRHPWIFRQYLRLKGIDRNIHVGSFFVHEPITIAGIAEALTQKGTNERTITILPCLNLRDIAEYFEKEGLIEDKEIFFAKEVGEPAHEYSLKRQLSTLLFDIDRWQMNVDRATADPALQLSVLKEKRWDVSLEGYLAPDTYRVYSNASVHDVVLRLLQERDKQFSPDIHQAIKESGRTIHEILTMASILEREVQKKEDKAMVADIFWRRLKLNWALQADSTVHYAVGKKGNVFTTAEDRAADSPWNTYKYPGLPPGPICNPGMESILAAIHPEKNDYWYFLTTPEGGVKYAKTLEEHNLNRVRFLR